MNRDALHQLHKLADQMCSGFAPKGEACFDAGKLLRAVLNGPNLFGVAIAREDGNGTEFLAVVAVDEAQAAEFALSDCPGVVESVGDLVSVIEDQYNGVAVLSTGGF